MDDSSVAATEKDLCAALMAASLAAHCSTVAPIANAYRPPPDTVAATSTVASSSVFSSL